MSFKTALQSLRQFRLPHTRELEHELDSVRAEHQAVARQLEQVRDEFERAHDGDQQQIALLKTQLGDIEYDRNAAHQQVQSLERTLEKVREEFESAHNNDVKQITALQSQLVQLESDRNNARQQAQVLEGSLLQAAQRQETTEQRIRALETQLEQTRNRHESELSLAQDALAGLQSEQRSLLSMQSDMTRSFSTASHELVKTIQTRSRLPVWQLSLVACLLFLSGVLAAALVLRESREPVPALSDISHGIDDLQLMMQTHFKTHEDLIETLTRLISGLSKDNPPPPATPVPDVLEPDDHVRLDAMPGDQVRQVQKNLQTLGFDIGASGIDGISGEQTGRALAWFRTLYLPGNPEASVQELEVSLQHHADTARADAEKYRVDSAVLAAIRLGSLRTGVEFPYLMELASVESSFNPRASASTTSAAGLYQFKEETWLEAVRRHGGKYGLKRYARQIEFVVGDDGYRQPVIKDPALRQQVLDLRLNPLVCTLLAAEKVRDGKRRLSGKLSREPDRTDLYLTHFFGVAGALSFLKVLADNPDVIAGEIFPGAARRNRNIFQRSNHSLRTVAEVYHLLARKFNTSRFEGG